MPGIPSLFGDGATLGLGGGPIRSQDQNLVTFNTGPKSSGPKDNTSANFALIIGFLIGVILWLLFNSKR